MDEGLFWKEHIHAISKKLLAVSVNVKRVRSFIFHAQCYYIYLSNHILITTVLFGMACLDRWERNRLQKPQNRVVRVITKWSYNTNPCYLFRSALSWDNLSVRRVKQKTNLIYKCFNKLASVYLCNMFIPRALSFALRQKLYQPKRFSYSGASLSENSSRGCSHCKNSSPLDIF